MRAVKRLLPMLLLLCLLPIPGLCQEDGLTLQAYLDSLPVPEDETLLPASCAIPDYALNLIGVARQELGYTEERSGVTKYGTWAGYPTAEWCAEFLCWCVHRADTLYGTRLLNSVYPNYSGTNVGRDWFLTQGRYIARSGFVPGWGSQWWKDGGEGISSNSYVPQPGDWVFLTDNSAGDTSHVALVEFCAVTADGEVRVHVIEGNNVLKPSPQSVERNVYPLTYWKILGYGTVYDLADITLKFGCSGPKVKALQEELVAAGLLESQYTTGRYGALTETAVKTFQQQAGVAANGIANRETRMLLQAWLEKRATSN